MARVIKQPSAKADLAAIGRFVAFESRSKAVAIRFVRKLVRRCQTCADFPEHGELCSHLGSGVRRFSVSNYNLYFRKIVGGIELLRVIHGSRDEQSAWQSKSQSS